MIKNIVLAIVLAIQLGLLFVVDPPWEDDPPATEGLANQKLEALPLEDLAKFQVIDARGTTATIQRRDGQWAIDEAFGFPVAIEKVAAAVAELEAFPRATLRSSKPVMFSNFGVEDGQATKIVLTAEGGTEFAKILVGKQDLQGTRGTFIRLEGDDRTWVLPSQKLATVFPANPRSWYDATMMDVSPQDQARMTDLREACYRVSIESNTPSEEDPSRIEATRFVFEKTPGKDGQEVTWKVVEPQEKSALVLDDLLVKNLVSQILGIRAYRLVAASARPEHGLDDPDEMRLRVEARFRENGEETSRTIEIGAKLPPSPGTPAGRGEFRCARASHPSATQTGSFVFGVPETFPRYFEQAPERYQKREIGEGR